MDTKLSTNRKFKRMFANILSIVAILAIAFPAIGSVSAQGPEPEPIIKISTSNNYLRADNFAPNTTVTFTVYATQDTNEDPIWIDSRQTDGSGFAIIWPGDDPHPPDLVVGNYVVAKDDMGNEKQLVLEPLTIEVFNTSTDFVAGTASPGEFVWVVVGNDTIGYPAGIWAEANANGIWAADFAQVYDFSDDMWGSAEVADDDWDVTVYHLGPTSTPSLIAFPEDDAVEAWGWPDGATVYLTIDNAPEDFVREETAEVTSWGDPRTYIRFDFAGDDGYDLQVGDMVTLTDQFGQSTTHTVQSLSVTEVNEDTDTVAGMADIGAVVQIWPHGYDQDFFIEDTAEDGTWFADFGSLGFHTIEETGGRAQVVINGNATAVNWNVPEPPPNPHFTVFPEWEFFDGLDWPDGATVTITVAGKPECETTKESWDGFFNGNFGEGCDVDYGDEVTFTDGTTTRTHNVRTLYVTDVDMAANTVSGKAEVEAGTIIYVWAHDGDFEPLQFITTDSDEWTVDLSGAYTIRDDSEGRSEIRDEMGNATASDWHVTHPRFTVFPEWEWFDGNDWPNEAEVTISVADKDGKNKSECGATKESWGYFFNGSFGDECDVVIGDTVTFTDGETTRTHTVQNLTVTKANYDDDTIKGISDPGAEVYVWPHATGEQQLAIAKTGGAAQGKWHVDFSGIYDLTPGECGRSEIRDVYANSTAVDWCISNPRIVASESGDWFWTTEFKPGDLDISIYDSPDENANLLWSGQQVADESGFAFVGFDIHGQDLAPGNYLVISDGDSQKNLVLQPISVTMFDTQYEFMAGFAPAGSEVWAAAGPQDWQERIMVEADPDTGEWFANFAEIGFDITEDMQPGSYAHIYDEDGDANEGGVPPLATWIAAFTYDSGTWITGEHSYYFDYSFSFPDSGSESTPPIAFTVSDEAPQYGGHVSLRRVGMRARIDGGCPEIGLTIDSDQMTRFVYGWITDYPMTYQEAQAHFDSMTVTAHWDNELSADLTRHEIMEFGSFDVFQYFCSFTADFILDANQPDWVDSGITMSAGQSFTIDAFGLMNPCSETYPNGADLCIFYTPQGGGGAVPYENEFGIFPGPGLPFMGLLGKIDGSGPFYVGEGGTFTAEQDGTLWFTPNDNLRTDNQGAYGVLVWLEP